MFLTMENKKYNIDEIKCVLDKEYDKYVNKTIKDDWLEKQVTFDSIYEDAHDLFVDVVAKHIGTDCEHMYDEDEYQPALDICSDYSKKFTKLVHRKLEEKFDIVIDPPFPSEQGEIDSHIDLAFFRGSVVYGIEPTDRSDVDIVAVVDDYISLPKMYGGDCMYERPDDYKNGDSKMIDKLLLGLDEMYMYLPVHVSYIRRSDFIKMIIDNDIVAYEALYLPEGFYFGFMREYQKHIELDRWKLRQNVSAIVNNSWAKCHKKLTVKEDYDWYRAIKSLFHCFRLYEFARQIVTYGEIKKYSAANNYWRELYVDDVVPSHKWEDYKKMYQPRLNALRSEFVKFAPKPY